MQCETHKMLAIAYSCNKIFKTVSNTLDRRTILDVFQFFMENKKKIVHPYVIISIG